MSTLYQRNFNVGRLSEQLYNKELHEIYESIRHLLELPENNALTPTAKLDGSLWLNRKDNTLKSFHKSTNTWKNIFDSKFQIIDNITNSYPPSNPIIGQLWIYEGTLFWYNGTEWTPIKSQLSDGSDIDMSLFKNFLFVSQLNEKGSTVVDTELIKEYNEKIKMYIEGKLDYTNDDFFKSSDKWKIGDNVQGDEFSPADIVGVNLQFLVPNVNMMRMFLDGKLDTSYKTVSTVCVQYPAEYIKGAKKSGYIHINPGHLQSIEKILVKIDRVNPKIEFSSSNYELYGFQKTSPFGTLLFPEKEQDDGGYVQTSDGVILSYAQAQNYDYVLAVSYDFGWLKMTGKLNHGNSTINQSTYYIPNFNIPLNLFVNGYNLEETSYEADNLSKTITINENTYNYTVNGFETVFREMGFVRQVDINNNAVIRVEKRYRHPLIFMNGEAIDTIPVDSRNGEFGATYNRTDGIIKVPDGKLNMVWAVAEMCGDSEDADFDMFVQTGIAETENETTITGKQKVGEIYTSDEEDPSITHVVSNVYQVTGTTNKKIIRFNVGDSSSDVKKTDTLILFVKGMYLDPKEITVNYDSGYLTFEGEIDEAYDYILLKDRYNKLLNNTQEPFKSAIHVGKFNESMVYLNGSLIMNNAPLLDFRKPEEVTDTYYNQIKFFVTNETRDKNTNKVTTIGDYYVFRKQLAEDGTDISCWEKLDEEEKEIINSITHSYTNLTNAISIQLDSSLHDADNDIVDVYGYKYATYEGTPLTINNIEISQEQIDEPATYPNDYTTDFKSFEIPESFVPGYNLLSVYVNGLMQYDIVEHSDGSGFNLGETLTEKAHISYVIESPDQYDENYVRRIVLDENNAVPGANNVYRTYPVNINNYEPKISLYPGKVTVYIDGIRQPQNSYSIIDNYTIMFNDDSRALIGNTFNYPEEVLLDSNNLPIKTDTGEVRTIHHKKADRILVEVKQDYTRVENYIEDNKSTTANYSINAIANNLPIEIIDSNDEILIYVNGLFPGLKLNDGMKYAYTRDTARGTIDILDPDVCEVIESKGPLYMQLANAKGAYKEVSVYVPVVEKKISELTSQLQNDSLTDDERVALETQLESANIELTDVNVQLKKAQNDLNEANKAINRYIDLFGDYDADKVNFILDWRNI